MPDKTFFLGQIERVDSEHHAVGIRSMYQSGLGETWHSLDGKGAQVLWWTSSEQATLGTWWYYWVVHESEKVGDIYYSQKAKQTQHVFDVLNMSEDYDTLEEIRREFFDGHDPRFVPSSPVYVWADLSTWIGPLHLERGGRHGTWHMRPEAEPLDLWHPPSQFILIEGAAKTNKPRFFALEEQVPHKKKGQIDWSSDKDVLKRALQWLRKKDTKYTDALQLTKSGIDKAVQLLDAGGLSGEGDPHLRRQQIERAAELLRKFNQYGHLIDQFSSEILAVPAVQVLIEKATATAKQAAQTAFEQETTQAREENQRLWREVEELEKEMQQLQQDIEEKKVALESGVAAFDDTLQQRLTEIRGKPAQMLAEVEILRAVLGVSVGAPQSLTVHNSRNGSQPHLETAIAVSLPTGNNTVQALKDREGLKKALRAAMKGAGLPARAGMMLQSATLAGAVPVTAGGGARKALEYYGAAIAGGRTLWLPVSPSWLEPRDWLQMPMSVTGGAPLASWLEAASQCDELFLVVLDGLNRAAVEAYLLPVLSAYATADAPSTGMCGAFSWPSNVLLAGTLSDGVATVPPPRSFWSSALLFHLDRFIPSADDESGAKIATPLSPSVSAVPPVLWHQWRDSVEGKDVEPCADLVREWIREGTGASRDALAMCGRFFAHARELPPNSDDAALEEVLCACLLPQSIAAGRVEKAQAITSLPKDFEACLEWTQHALI